MKWPELPANTALRAGVNEGRLSGTDKVALSVALWVKPKAQPDKRCFLPVVAVKSKALFATQQTILARWDWPKGPPRPSHDVAVRSWDARDPCYSFMNIRLSAFMLYLVAFGAFRAGENMT